MPDDVCQPISHTPLPLPELAAENEALKVENTELKGNIASLETKLREYEKQDKEKKAVIKGINSLGRSVLKRFFIGTQVYEKSVALWDACSSAVRTRQTEQIEKPAKEFSASVLARLLRISTIGVILALTPTMLIIIQTTLLYYQNQKIDVQNELITKQNQKFDSQNEFIKAQNDKIDRQVALQVYEHTTKFRELLRLPPLDDKGDFIKDYPFVRAKASVWLPPNLSTVQQILVLGEKEPELVIRALKPLLTDEDPTIAAGALLVIQDLTQHTNENIADIAQKALNPGLGLTSFVFGLRVNLNCIKNLNLSQFNLTKVDLSFTNLAEADLSFTNLTGANLSGATFRKANLNRANLNEARLVGADFSGANLTGASLIGVNLIGVNLSGVILTDANLSGAILIDAFVYSPGGQKIPITVEYLKSEGGICDDNICL